MPNPTLPQTETATDFLRSELTDAEKRCRNARDERDEYRELLIDALRHIGQRCDECEGAGVQRVSCMGDPEYADDAYMALWEDCDGDGCYGGYVMPEVRS